MKRLMRVLLMLCGGGKRGPKMELSCPDEQLWLPGIAAPRRWEFAGRE